jgi:hypothetical protein
MSDADDPVGKLARRCVIVEFAGAELVFRRPELVALYKRSSGIASALSISAACSGCCCAAYEPVDRSQSSVAGRALLRRLASR